MEEELRLRAVRQLAPCYRPRAVSSKARAVLTRVAFLFNHFQVGRRHPRFLEQNHSQVKEEGDSRKVSARRPGMHLGAPGSHCVRPFHKGNASSGAFPRADITSET